MTAAEAIKALSKNISKRPTSNHTECFNEHASFNQGSCSTEIDGSTTHGSLQLLLTEDLPSHPHLMRVTMISWQENMPRGNDAAVDLYVRGLKAKFGPPDVAKDSNGFPAWCSELPCETSGGDSAHPAQYAVLSDAEVAGDMSAGKPTPTLIIVDNGLKMASSTAEQQAAAKGVAPHI